MVNAKRRITQPGTNTIAVMMLAGISALSLSALSLPLAAEPTPTQIVVEVFVSLTTTITGVESLTARGSRITLYPVDDIARLNALLSVDLPNNAQQAAKVAMARITQNHEQLKPRYARGANGLLRAARHRLNRFPAIVFDSRAVVYGVTDLEVAYKHYTRWQADQSAADQTP